MRIGVLIFFFFLPLYASAFQHFLCTDISTAGVVYYEGDIFPKALPNEQFSIKTDDWKTIKRKDIGYLGDEEYLMKCEGVGFGLVSCYDETRTIMINKRTKQYTKSEPGYGILRDDLKAGRVTASYGTCERL